MKNHIWRGKIITNEEFINKIDFLEEEVNITLQDRLSTEAVLNACDSISEKMRLNKLPQFEIALKEDGCENPSTIINGLVNNLTREALEQKLVSELGSTNPFIISKKDFSSKNFEAWSPMGVLVHITAGNSPIVAPMATVEGLLSGNINVIKTASNMGSFPTVFLEELSKYDNLGDYIYLFRVSSKDEGMIKKILNYADCISAWGSENAISGIRAMAPKGVPVVSWGHRISFAYITPSQINQETADNLIKSICRNNQQSCSSPQCAFIDTENNEDILEFAKLLQNSFEKAKSEYSNPNPDINQQAEITAVTLQHKADLYFNSGSCIEDKDNTYRILISYNTKFMPSPLFRTIWLSPLKNNQLVKTIRRMRGYLQTAGLACDINEVEKLSYMLYRGGVSRITPLASMSASYSGEPHDGIYALPHFLKRVSFRTELPFESIVHFDSLKKSKKIDLSDKPIQNKKDYPKVPDEGTRILMKSGGTTGEPVYCSYSQKDYLNYIVKAGAESLIAAGLDVKKDVTADLLKAGNLYGGMNCFISVFDYLNAPHVNVSGLDDYKLAAKYIIKGRANALLGAPSYIIHLLKENEAEFIKYGRIKKIFFGGEAMSQGQKDYLINTFGIESIRSMLYGANETGTMGYSCEYCKGNEFHLCEQIQHLEVLKMDSDEPCELGEVGRLIFTGFKRENGHTERYEIGDMGYLIEEECKCGRKDTKFCLTGRYGDVIRMSGTFFNYRKISKILSDSLGYGGRLQLILKRDNDCEVMEFCMEGIELSQEKLQKVLLESAYDSFLKTVPTGLMKIKLNIINSDEFVINKTSMKLRSIIDKR